MNDNLILNKLDKLEVRFDKLESAISTLAVQSERLDNLSRQTKALWDKHDEAFKPGGYIDVIKAHQAACPKETMRTRFKELWLAYALLSTVVAGVILKAIK